MKISKFILSRLRNAEHFQFLTEFANLVNHFGANGLKIVKLFARFAELLSQEDKCLVILQKSGYTEQMAETDRLRDTVFSGLVDTMNASRKHFNQDVVEAGNRLKIVFDTYGNLAAKPNDEETSGITNLVQDLEGKFSPDIRKIGASDWVAELKAKNIAYNELVRSRDAETSLKPETKMKNIRIEIDGIYRDITTAIESLAKLTNDDTEIETYQGFISQFNPIVERYRNRIAQREGASAAKKSSSTIDNVELIIDNDE